jgi:hypothetical protein
VPSGLPWYTVHDVVASSRGALAAAADVPPPPSTIDTAAGVTKIAAATTTPMAPKPWGRACPHEADLRARRGVVVSVDMTET